VLETKATGMRLIKFTHLLEQEQENKELLELSLEDYDLIPFEKLTNTDSYNQVQ